MLLSAGGLRGEDGSPFAASIQTHSLPQEGPELRGVQEGPQKGHSFLDHRDEVSTCAEG